MTVDDPAFLAELKGVSLSKTWYPLAGASHTRSAGAACSHRASRVPAEYRLKADKLDKKFFAGSYTPPAPGPVTQRLASFGPIKALVFGAFAEVMASTS